MDLDPSGVKTLIWPVDESAAASLVPSADQAGTTSPSVFGMTAGWVPSAFIRWTPWALML